MSDKVLSAASLRKSSIVLSQEERILLNTIIDRLIPSDENFPPPSSLHLIDEFLHYLIPNRSNKGLLVLNEQRLHLILSNVNEAAGGCFCNASTALQHSILQNLEWQEPALFQALWSLANHSYYTRIASIPRRISN